MNSSVIDLPRKKSEKDLFGIQKYQNALVEFIKNSQTPLTIALQGEWGSGKTSLMNLLDDELVDKGKFYKVWINSWQYSLMKTPEESILKIVEGMIEQILKTLSDNDGKNETVKRMKSVFRKISISGGKFLAKQLVDKVGGNAEYIDDLFSGEGAEGAEISQMKNEIEKLIKEILEKNKDKGKTGFIFFIDDLDRIDPPIAVQILELLKNIFDLDKCIFILAIDYDVVIKGLEPKFGKLTENNEREFRSFFDKIIQMPFSMPVASYTIDVFLIDALKKISFINEKEANETNFTKLITDFASLSVGQNPRALKRLTNTLSLINIINKLENENNNIENEKIIGFAMVCLQIAYPLVYNKLLEDSNFVKWDEHTAIKLDLSPLTDVQKEKLNKTEEFNDPWEKVVFQMCQKESFSKNRVFQISTLLNKVKVLIPEEQDLGGVLESILEQSAITNLVAFDKPIVINLSKKDSIKLMMEFSEQLFNKFSSSEILNNNLVLNPAKGSFNWYEFFILSIPILNTKFKDFQFTLQVIQSKNDKIYSVIRAWKNNKNKNGQNPIFDNAWAQFTNNGAPSLRGDYALTWQYYPIDFSSLDQNMIKLLDDSIKKKELIDFIAKDSEKFIKIFQEAMEADK